MDLNVHGATVRVSIMRRDGPRTPIVFLHGFGSTKEDYADIIRHRSLDGHAALAFDAPGCGETICDDPIAIDLPFLVETTKGLIARFALTRFHLVGHSMGGLTALLVAHAHPRPIVSFTNIEGNLAPEDCFLSREIMAFKGSDPSDFFEQFIERVWHAGDFSGALYASRLRHTTKVRAVPTLFRSIVEYSERGALLKRFIDLPCARLFIYGERNRSLSYLDALRGAGIELCEISECGHFPMYSNPPAMWCAIGNFIGRSEKDEGHG